MIIALLCIFSMWLNENLLAVSNWWTARKNRKELTK